MSNIFAKHYYLTWVDSDPTVESASIHVLLKFSTQIHTIYNTSHTTKLF